jgi:glycosyltransferase involved in cell wall biosynthesis
MPDTRAERRNEVIRSNLSPVCIRIDLVRLSASVIVPTRNRDRSLRRTIDSVLSCAGSAEEFEIVVVDNASTDGTAEVVALLKREHPDAALTYVFEDQIGAHYARHAGARAAQSSLLLFTDDDVEVDPGWVGAYVRAFAAHPQMVAAGGPVSARWETRPPGWLSEVVAANWFCLPLALIDRGPEFLLSADGDFFALNMAIRADALERFGGFRPDYVGGEFVGSGEWGLQMAMQRAAAQVGWVPQARAWHWIPARKLEPRYFEGWVQQEAFSRMFERWRLTPRSLPAVARDFVRIVRSNWRPWLRAASVRRAADAQAIEARSEGLKGFYELAYLWNVITRRDIRAYLDAERFGP